MIEYQYPILCALAAIAWTMKITGPDGILSSFPIMFKKHINDGKLAHVLFDCAGCNAAWWMIALLLSFGAPGIHGPVTALFNIVFYITTSITFAMVGELIINKLK